MYRVRIIRSATRELENLDENVAVRIVRRIRWLATNVDLVRHVPLKGKLAGFYKLRVGITGSSTRFGRTRS